MNRKNRKYLCQLRETREKIYFDLRQEMMEYNKLQYTLTIFIYTVTVSLLGIALSDDVVKVREVYLFPNLILLPGLVRILGIRLMVKRITEYISDEKFFGCDLTNWDRRSEQVDRKTNGILNGKINIISIIISFGKGCKYYDYSLISIVCTILFWFGGVEEAIQMLVSGIVSILLPILMLIFTLIGHIAENKKRY